MVATLQDVRSLKSQSIVRIFQHLSPIQVKAFWDWFCDEHDELIYQSGEFKCSIEVEVSEYGLDPIGYSLEWEQRLPDGTILDSIVVRLNLNEEPLLSRHVNAILKLNNL